MNTRQKQRYLIVFAMIFGALAGFYFNGASKRSDELARIEALEAIGQIQTQHQLEDRKAPYGGPCVGAETKLLFYGRMAYCKQGFWH